MRKPSPQFVFANCFAEMKFRNLPSSDTNMHVMHFADRRLVHYLFELLEGCLKLHNICWNLLKRAQDQKGSNSFKAENWSLKTGPNFLSTPSSLDFNGFSIIFDTFCSTKHHAIQERQRILPLTTAMTSCQGGGVAHQFWIDTIPFPLGGWCLSIVDRPHSLTTQAPI